MENTIKKILDNFQDLKTHLEFLLLFKDDSHTSTNNLVFILHDILDNIETTLEKLHVVESNESDTLENYVNERKKQISTMVQCLVIKTYFIDSQQQIM